MRSLVPLLLVFLLSGCDFFVYELPQLNPAPRLSYYGNLEAAQHGNAIAQAAVGEQLYWACRPSDYLGWRPPCDREALVKWNTAAANQGNVAAMFTLGEFYERDVEPSNYAEALKWYRKAADRGHTGAQSELSTMYKEGWGVKQDYAEACFWSSLGSGNRDYVREMEKHLTLKQIATVEERVVDWQKGHPATASK
jgi:hypothetical protein